MPCSPPGTVTNGVKDGPPGSEVAVLGRYPGLGLAAVPLTLLLHDARVSGSEPASIEALPELLEEMEAAGLRSVTVSELVAGAVEQQQS